MTLANASPVAETLANLDSLSLDDLRKLWPARFRAPAPRFRSRDLMARALAYRLQSAEFGGLSPKAERRLAELARRFSDDRRFTPVAGPVLKPGTSLIREWRGVRHEVRVTDVGFIYQGQPFRSLSSIARHITGTKWNGLAFFGLKSAADTGGTTA